MNRKNEMPMIVVTQGPDQGREYPLEDAIVRIGRGPQATLRLKDPSLRGEIVVEFSDNVYKVTNGVNSPIYLDDKAFPAGETRVWFDGLRLQPTAETVLVLRHDSVVPKSFEIKSRPGWQSIAAGFVVLVSSMILLSNPHPKVVAPKWEEVEYSIAMMITLEANLADRLRAIDFDLNKARNLESAGQWKLAAGKYRDVRHECERLEPIVRVEAHQQLKLIRTFAGAGLDKCIKRQ